MHFISWESRFELGVPEMDAQHKELVELIDNLHDVMNREAGREEVAPAMENIREHARAHFATEEDLMVRHGYQGYAVHKGIHEELLKQVDILVRRYGGGGRSFSMDILRFILTWLTEHIEGEDLYLAEFLKRVKTAP